MAQRKGKLSVAHRYGVDYADGDKEVFALTLIHIFKSRAIVLALLVALVSLNLIPAEATKEAIGRLLEIDESNQFLSRPAEDNQTQ
jgi:hypothetical protein